MNKLNIIGVKTDKCFYVSIFTGGYRPYSDLQKYIIDGENPKQAFLDGWSEVRSEPKIIEIAVRQPRINHRFVLKHDAPWVDSSNLPKCMPKSEVMIENEDEYCEWKEEFKHLQSLYEEISDEQPDKIERVEFDYKTVFNIDVISHCNGKFIYSGCKGSEYTGGNLTIGENEITHQDIDRIMFPPILLPNTKCKLSSERSYQIIREHVRSNIDPRYARITSDYDFCFSVAKIVPLNVPIHKRSEIKSANGRSYAKKRYKEWTVASREIKDIYSIGHSGHPYAGYPAINGFYGETHIDLKNNIDKYLDDLMARINEPLVDCPKCNGIGVVIEST